MFPIPRVDFLLDLVNKMTVRRIPLEAVVPFVGSDFWEAKRMAFPEAIVNTALGK